MKIWYVKAKGIKNGEPVLVTALVPSMQDLTKHQAQSRIWVDYHFSAIKEFEVVEITLLTGSSYVLSVTKEM